MIVNMVNLPNISMLAWRATTLACSLFVSLIAQNNNITNNIKSKADMMLILTDYPTNEKLDKIQARKCRLHCMLRTSKATVNSAEKVKLCKNTILFVFCLVFLLL